MNTIYDGTFVIGQTSATNFQAGPGISITQPSEGTVRIASDETVLWESNTAWSGGNTDMKANFTLSEQVSAFDKVDIHFWKKYGSYFSYEVATIPVISNTIQYCVDPFPENMLTGSWFNMKLYGSGNNCGYSGGFNSVQSQSMTGWASQDMWSHGNIYKIVGINRIGGNE